MDSEWIICIRFQKKKKKKRGGEDTPHAKGKQSRISELWRQKLHTIFKNVLILNPRGPQGGCRQIMYKFPFSIEDI